MKQLLFIFLWAAQSQAGTIGSYLVDVDTPRFDIDSFGILGLPGIGRALLPGVSAVACLEDLADIGDGDYNDYCVYAPAVGPLVFIGGLSAYASQDTAVLFSGQILFTSPQGQWLTGTDHAWVGYIASHRDSDTPEPATWAMVLAVIGLYAISRARASASARNLRAN